MNRLLCLFACILALVVIALPLTATTAEAAAVVGVDAFGNPIVVPTSGDFVGGSTFFSQGFNSVNVVPVGFGGGGFSQTTVRGPLGRVRFNQINSGFGSGFNSFNSGFRGGCGGFNRGFRGAGVQFFGF